MIEFIFWFSLFIAFYTYVGYGILLYILIRIKKKETIKNTGETDPHVCLFITAYNEKDFVRQKIENSMALDYPKEKLHHLWITDGSDDGTPEIIRNEFPSVKVLHQPERRGKIAAMNRGMKEVETPIVIFSDANTLLGEKSIRKIVELFQDPKTACVSGEKRIMNGSADAAAGAGEGLYWKYESTLKKWDSQLYSVVGAAGELFAIRTALFEEVESDTILDDFIISLRVAMKGYKIKYNPEAYAIETASANVKEELKRKIRIAAGGIQSVVRLYPLLNIFKYKTLSFQYISHRVLRWTITPMLLPIILSLNFFLIENSLFYQSILAMQILFYALAMFGWMVQGRKFKIKGLFVPYYFFIMNYAVYLGFFRYIKKAQTVNWERAKRA